MVQITIDRVTAIDLYIIIMPEWRVNNIFICSYVPTYIHIIHYTYCFERAKYYVQRSLHANEFIIIRVCWRAIYFTIYKTTCLRVCVYLQQTRE